jgi:hypothetical protein
MSKKECIEEMPPHNNNYNNNNDDKFAAMGATMAQSV